MQGKLVAVDIHQQLGQKEAQAAKGKLVPAPMFTVVLSGLIDGHQIQVGIQTEDQNMVHGLALGGHVGVTIELPILPSAFEVVK